MSRQLSLEKYEDFHESLESLRDTGERNMTHCPGCDYMVWEDKLEDGLCPECRRQHHAEITGDDVG
jgi:acetyl-CoA carboxylase beta subunit